MVFINNLKTPTSASDIRNFIHFATGDSRLAKSHRLQNAVCSTNLFVTIFTFRDFPEFGMHYTLIINCCLHPCSIKQNFLNYLSNHSDLYLVSNEVPGIAEYVHTAIAREFQDVKIIMIYNVISIYLY